MKLQTDKWQCSMFDRHDGKIFGASGYFEAGRKTLFFGDQRMVPAGKKRRRDVFEHLGSEMLDLTLATVHRLIGGDDFTTEGLHESLMTKADSQHRNLAREALYDFD